MLPDIKGVKISGVVRTGLDANPDPAFYLNADPDQDPGPGSQTNVDPDPDPLERQDSRSVC